jgi:hypothetical protein
MEGLSTITYKNKTIIHIDYTKVLDSQAKIIQLIKEATDEYRKCPPASVLALVNVRNVKYNMNIVDTLTKSQNDIISLVKKIAVVGVDDLIKVAYDYIISLPEKNKVQIFNSEIEAKEWLVSDE